MAPDSQAHDPHPRATAQQRWLDAIWPTVQSHLPSPPAAIAELGCGRLGGFVPKLLASGYDAVGIDPVAPDGDEYRQEEFERSELPPQLGAVVACTSLHHVADPGAVLDRIARGLAPRGLVVVVEWDWEGFDEAAARWCFERLGASETDSWLHHHRDEWMESGESWETCFRGWAEHHGLHPATQLVRDLDERFERLVFRRGPYYFSELSNTTEADELAAIEAGRIPAARIDYVGRVG